MIADTPDPPYYAVIFTSVRTKGDTGYISMSEKMLKLAKRQDGFLGVEPAHEETGITVSYWKNLDSIQKRKENLDHTVARKKGREEWYQAFKARISRVERDYGFSKGDFF